MKFILSLIILIVAVSSIEIDSPEYKKLSASEKRKELWGKIKGEGKVGWLSKLELLKLFFADMNPSMKHYGDQIPKGRTKYIHSYGMVGLMELISTNDHKYTGIFEGCKNAIGRLSLPKNYKDNDLSEHGARNNNFVPAMAIKCIFDGSKRSANLLTMYGVDGGQESWNFFKNNQSNHIAEYIESRKLRLVGKKFSTAAPYFATLGLSQAATIGENGKHYVKPIFPFEIIFKPNAELRSKFTDKFQEPWDKQLGSIEPGTMLYELWAKENKDSNEVKIGELKLVDEKLIHSEYADKYLFFQHGDFEKDMIIRPELKGTRRTYTEVYGKTILQKINDFFVERKLTDQEALEEESKSKESLTDPAIEERKKKKLRASTLKNNKK